VGDRFGGPLVAVSLGNVREAVDTLCKLMVCVYSVVCLYVSVCVYEYVSDCCDILLVQYRHCSYSYLTIVE
jgi:hypothetical protein